MKRQGTGNREQGTALAVLAAVIALSCVLVRAQDIQFGEKRAPAGKGHVSYAPEVAEDRPDSPPLDEPAAGARLPHAPCPAHDRRQVRWAADGHHAAQHA